MKHLAESRISPQGQMSLPSAAREYLRVGPGDTVVWQINDQGDLVARRKLVRPVEELRAQIFPEGVPSCPAVTPENLDEVVAEAWARDSDANR